MTEPKRFKKGKHSYTRWGTHFKEVRVENLSAGPGDKNEIPMDVTLEADAGTQLGVYSNMSVMHYSPEEAVLDFCYVPPGSKKGWVKARVILSHQHLKKLKKLISDPGNLKE